MTDVANMNQAAVVSSFSPAGSADTNGGETVTITGSGFIGVTSVAFGSYPADFTVVSDTEIQATAPAVNPGVGENDPAGKVTVWKDRLGSDASLLDPWTWAGKRKHNCKPALAAAQPAAPAGPVANMNEAAIVSSFSPEGSADTNGGETVTITGSGFIGVTSVAFGSYPAYFTVVSDTEIQATAPAVNPGVGENDPAGKVTVWKDRLGSDASLLYVWTWGGQTQADLQAAHAAAQPAAPAGPVANMNEAAMVSSFSPEGSADTNGGETVTITGSGFIGVTSVAFGSYPAYFTVVSDTEIQATAPAFNPGVGKNDPAGKVTVWKDRLGSDASLLYAWTWGGQTQADLQAAHAT